jgi:hypothetical protein
METKPETGAPALPAPTKPHKTASEASVRPWITSAVTRTAFLHKSTEMEEMLAHASLIEERCKAVSTGDMSLPEQMLVSQAMSLDMIFNDLAQRGASNVGTHLPSVEVYMRMALKAQAQCAATLRVLGELRSPRSVMFVKEQQNNVAHGNQQVNNHAPVTARSAESRPVSTENTLPVDSRVREGSQTHTNELLTDQNHAEEMDLRTACAPGRGNQDLAAVGGIDRPEVMSRQDGRLDERCEARAEIG